MSKPNILIFMTDQQRGDTVFPNNNKYNKCFTPNLNKLYNDGAFSFSNTFTVAPHCCPSRASFFTGLYPTEHGVWNNVDLGSAFTKGLYNDTPMFSDIMKDSEYDLYYTGKWHASVMERPSDRGFVEFGTVNVSQFDRLYDKPKMGEWNSYKNMTDPWCELPRKEAEIKRYGYGSYMHYGTKEKPSNDWEVISNTCDKLNELKDNDTPWLLYTGPIGPHDPYMVPQKYLDMYDINDIKLPDSFNDMMEDKPALYRKTRALFDQLTEQEQKESIRHYLAYCTYEDALFGEVVETLRNNNQYDNTIIIYTSDHGDYVGEHGLYCKGLPCFNSTYNIPFMIKLNANNICDRKNRVIDKYVSIVDIAPTILDLAGIECEITMSGRSVLPLITNETTVTDWKNEIYTQSNGNEQLGIQRSVMTDKWKYVYNGFDYDELYDLVNDPEQITNLINDIEYDEILKQMSKKLWRFAYEHNDVFVNKYIMVAHAKYGPGIIYNDSVN